MNCKHSPECSIVGHAPGPTTKDGKRTWEPICAGGRAGGCGVLANYDMLTEFDQQRDDGVHRRLPPTWLDKFGGKVGPSWKIPRVLNPHIKQKY